MTRAYRQGRRADAAADTRRRILDAVYASLREAPTRALSLNDVAELAGVARSTVYVAFGSRAGLFDAVGADLTERGRFEDVVAATERDDARETLREGIRATARMYEVDRDVRRVLVAMSRLDPEVVGDSVRAGERDRAGGMAHLARRLADQGHLRDGLRPAQAAHLLWVLVGFDAYDTLRTERRLSARAAAELLVESAERAICKG